MKTSGVHTVCVAALLAGGFVGVRDAMAGAGAQFENSSTVLNGLKAPASSESPWRPPDLRNFARELTAQKAPEADAQKDYELAELIDLAERINPETKVAWERAKQAASGVGLAQSEYFPILALRASAVYVRGPAP